MAYPDFSTGEPLAASDLDAIGLWLVKTQTVGSGVSSVTVTGAFSADYDNYRIIYDGGTSTTNGSLQLRMDNATTGYMYSVAYNQYNATGILGTGSAAAVSYVEAGRHTTVRNSVNCEVFNPFLSVQTGFRSASVDYSGAAGFIVTGGGMLNNTTSYTGFILLTTAGTMTGGTIRVYGYRN